MSRPLDSASGGLRRLGLASGAIILVILAASLGYWVLGQLHFRGALEPVLSQPFALLDCLYMTVITISTVGYTEALPLDPGLAFEDFTVLRVYTIGTILVAMLVVGFAVSSATAFLIEGDLARFWQMRIDQSRIDDLSNHYIVCGAGVTGSVILEELVQTQHGVVAIDLDEGILTDVRAQHSVPCLFGDATDEEVLKRAGIERAQGLAAALPNDRDNIFLIITARQLRKDNGLRVVSLSSDASVSEKVKAAGADEVVCASHIGGLRIASALFRPAVVTFLDQMLRGHQAAVRFAQVEVGPRWNGRTVGDLEQRCPGGLPVLALQTPDGQQLAFNPADDVELVKGSQVITMGEAERVSELRSLLAEA